MKRTNLIQALCLLTALVIPQANAAQLISPPATPDYNIVPIGPNGPGLTTLGIEIYNNVPVTMVFDPLFAPTENMAFDILNLTGAGWSNMTIEYQLNDPFDDVILGLSVLDSASIPTITNILTNPNTGSPTGLAIGFTPDEISFVTIIGTADRSISFNPYDIYSITITTSAVPVPAAVWLFGSGLIGLIGIARKKKA